MKHRRMWMPLLVTLFIILFTGGCWIVGQSMAQAGFSSRLVDQNKINASLDQIQKRIGDWYAQFKHSVENLFEKITEQKEEGDNAQLVQVKRGLQNPKFHV